MAESEARKVPRVPCTGVLLFNLDESAKQISMRHLVVFQEALTMQFAQSSTLSKLHGWYSKAIILYHATSFRIIYGDIGPRASRIERVLCKFADNAIEARDGG